MKDWIYIKGWKRGHGGGEGNWKGRVELRYYCKEQCQEHRYGGGNVAS